MANDSAFTEVLLKQCPDCSEMYEPELENCQCGYDFVNNPVSAEMVIEIDIVKLRASAEKRRRRNEKRIRKWVYTIGISILVGSLAIVIIGIPAGWWGPVALIWFWVVYVVIGMVSGGLVKLMRLIYYGRMR